MKAGVKALGFLQPSVAMSNEWLDIVELERKAKALKCGNGTF